MGNRLLLSAVLSLFIFQLLFSIFYSTQIINQNNLYKNLKKNYQLLHQKNQELEIRYIQKYSINHESTAN